MSNPYQPPSIPPKPTTKPRTWSDRVPDALHGFLRGLVIGLVLAGFVSSSLFFMDYQLAIGDWFFILDSGQLPGLTILASVLYGTIAGFVKGGSAMPEDSKVKTPTSDDLS